MMIKRLPEDFQVEELTSLVPSAGPFALYRLTKRSLGTFEAIDAIAARWKLPRQAIQYGGLKDRHALTRQFVTIERGPAKNLHQPGLDLEYLGPAPRAFSAQEITANRFAVVLRDLTADEVPRCQAALEKLPHDGLPNYFDDQRFGSLGETGEFVAAAWCRGNYERAIWLALADAHPDDPADEQQEKRILREHWGDWARCQRELAPGPRQRVISYLASPEPGRARNFRGAIALLRVDLRGMYLAALQGHLWNRMLACFLQNNCPVPMLRDVALQLGPVPFFTGLGAEEAARLTGAALPLPSARLHLPPGPLLDLVTQTLAAEGWTLRELRVKYPRDSFFSRLDRAVRVVPQGLTHSAAEDEIYRGRSKLQVAFDLPRGSYATLLCKWLQT